MRPFFCWGNETLRKEQEIWLDVNFIVAAVFMFVLLVSLSLFVPGWNVIIFLNLEFF